MENSLSGRKYFSSTRIAVIAMFSTLAGILYIFNFPIAVAFPSFLELHFSDVPALIGTFALGPLSGAIIVFIKILIKLVFKMTSTAFVGDLADLLIGWAFVIPAGLIYKRYRSLKGAAVALAVGSLSSTALAVLFNYLILVPFYLQFFFGGSWKPLVSMMTPLFPACNEQNFYNFYLWCSCLPFNVMRCLFAVLITLPVYKRISLLINRFNAKITPKEGDEAGGARARNVNLGLIIGGAAIILIFVAVILLRQFVFKNPD